MCADMRQHHGGCRAADAGHAVVLGDPIPRIAQRLGMSGKIGGLCQRLTDRAAFEHRNEVEHGEGGLLHRAMVGL